MEGATEMNKKICGVWILIFLTQFVCIFFLMSQREYLFVDEVYSYGLANSEDYSFLILEDHNWYTGDYFENYIKFDDGRPFSFDAAYINQTNDVHPPMYYYLLHLVCSFFPKHSYSAVPGIVLNLILLFLVDACYYCLACFFLKSDTKIIAALMLWGLSAAFFSNAVFVRMYFMETLMILLFVCAHIYCYRYYEKFNLLQALTYAVLVTLGGLTHYHFYFFAAAFGGCLCLVLLFSKRIKLMFVYGLSLVAGVVTAFLVFPATWNHIFGYRGSYATENLIGFSVEKFAKYYEWCSDSLLAGCGTLLIFVACLSTALYFLRNLYDISVSLEQNEKSYAIHYNIEKHVKFKKDGCICIEYQDLLIGSAIVANTVLAFVAIQGSEIIHCRYIYPIYPILSVCVVMVLDWCMKQFNIKKSKSLLCLVCLLLSIGSIKVYGIDWMYEDYRWKNDFVEEMKGQDFFVIANKNYWIDYYSGLNIYRNADEVVYVDDANLSNLSGLLAERKTNNKLFVSFPRNGYEYTDLERNAFLDEICKQCNFLNYYLKYDHDTYVYEMLK